MPTRVAVLSALALLGAVLPAPVLGASEVVRLMVGAGHPVAGSAWVQAVPEAFIPRVDAILARTGTYRVDWTQGYGGAIAKLGNVLEAVEDGILDVGVVIYPFDAAKLFPHSFTYKLPFGTCSAETAYRVASRIHDQFSQLKTIFEEKYNQKFLSTGGTSCHGMIAKFPWKGVADLKGRKIGAAGPNLPWVTAVGVVGVATTLNLAYTSLQTGVYEALIIFIDPVGGFKLYEPAPHWIDVGFGSTAPVALTVNLARFRGLPKEVQDAVVEAGREWGATTTRLGIANAERVAKDLKAAGVEFHSVSFDEKVRWAAGMPNIPNDFARDAASKGYGYVPALMRAYIKELEAAGEKQPRQWQIE